MSEFNFSVTRKRRRKRKLPESDLDAAGGSGTRSEETVPKRRRKRRGRSGSSSATMTGEGYLKHTFKMEVTDVYTVLKTRRSGQQVDTVSNRRQVVTLSFSDYLIIIQL